MARHLLSFASRFSLFLLLTGCVLQVQVPNHFSITYGPGSSGSSGGSGGSSGGSGSSPSVCDIPNQPQPLLCAVGEFKCTYNDKKGGQPVDAIDNCGQADARRELAVEICKSNPTLSESDFDANLTCESICPPSAATCPAPPAGYHYANPQVDPNGCAQACGQLVKDSAATVCDYAMQPIATVCAPGNYSCSYTYTDQNTSKQYKYNNNCSQMAAMHGLASQICNEHPSLADADFEKGAVCMSQPAPAQGH